MCRDKCTLRGKTERAALDFWSDQGIRILCGVYAFIIGAVFGSFLNCAAWRTAHGESFLKGHSRCPKCGHELGALDLVPLLSWVFLKGRCRYCGVKISARYPLTELCFALISLACMMVFGLSAECLRNWVFLCCLFFLSLVDLENSTIPDGSLIIAALAWLIALPFTGWSLKDAGLRLLTGLGFGAALLLISLLMDRLLKKDSLGGGDIKLFAVAGLYLGLAGTLFALMLSCIIGLIFALILFRGEARGKAFPFGPSIAAACALMLLFGQGLTDWYLGLLGL